MLQRAGLKRQISVLFPVLISTLFQCLPALSAEEWIGRKFMPKSGAKYLQEDVEIPYHEIALPFTISKTSNGWLWMGKAWIKKEYVVPVEDAIAYYTEYLHTNPNEKWAYTARGISLEKIGEYDNAIKDYSKAIQLDPLYARAYNNRGTAWYNKGKYDNALKDYTKAIQINPKDSMPYCNRGAVWYHKNKYDNAIADYSRAIQLNPKNAKTYNDRGTIWRKKGKYVSAIKDYNEAIQINPKFAHAYNNLAWCLSTCPEAHYRNGREAVTMGRRACELSDWKNTDFINTLAAAYAESGKFDQAERYQKLCLEMPGKDADKQKYKEQLNFYISGKPYRHEDQKVSSN